MEISTCQFSDSYFPIMDGVGMTAHSYAQWLNGKYGITSVVAPKVKGYKDRTDYKVYRFKSVLLPGMNPYRVGLPLIDIKFKKTIKSMKFDLLHAHCPFISGQLAQKLAQKMDVPLVATFHTKYKEDFKRVINNALFVDFLLKYTLDFYQKADYVWVPNKATGKTLEEYGYKGNYDIVPNGCDMDIPSKSKLIKLRKKGLERMSATGEDFIMLFVGQHRWEKNVRMILEAMHSEQLTRQEFKMVFVGEGYAVREMKRLCKQLNLDQKVRFLGLISDRKELMNLYAASDLFVFPSAYDNSPLVIQEAAAFDLPSVLIKGSASAEGIVDGVNGFLVENHPEALATCILKLKQSPDSIKLAGKGARKSIYQPWEAIVQQVYIKYADILTEWNSKMDKSVLEEPFV